MGRTQQAALQLNKLVGFYVGRKPRNFMSHASGVCRVNSSCARSLFMNPRVRGLLKWKTFPMEWIIIIILVIHIDS